MGVAAFKVEAMKIKFPKKHRQKLYQFLQCAIPNFIGLYVDAYLGFGLSIILLLWNWHQETGDRS